MDGTGESGPQDWGPFGRPLFNDPSTRALRRVGVVDVGSNSVRLVVFDGAARSPAYFYNEKIMCGLGEGLGRTGRLNPAGRERALAALHRFQHLAEGMGIAPLTAVATAAVRNAEDGPEFCDQIARETGLRVHVIDGREEARLSAQGVMLGWPGAYGLICDIGGASMELAEINSGSVGRRVTSPLGPLQLQTVKGGRNGRREFIRKTLERLAPQLGAQKNRLFLVGGSWRAIARIDIARRGYPLHVLHEYRMSRKAISSTLKLIADTKDLEKLRQKSGVSASRMALVPLAAEVLREVIRAFHPHDIAVSSYGIREGLLYEQMPQELRDRDPLIEACRFAEAKDARLPGFGRSLYHFILPLFSSVDEDRKRLIRAACLLHDVNWRAHPDYRAEACFDSVTRANLGGLTHRERVYLGLALMYRYSNKRDDSRFAQVANLLGDADIHQAEVLGKAMRFGAMLWVQGAPLGELRWFPRKKELELWLSRHAEPLFSEVAEARLNSLAQTLAARTRVKRRRTLPDAETPTLPAAAAAPEAGPTTP